MKNEQLSKTLNYVQRSWHQGSIILSIIPFSCYSISSKQFGDNRPRRLMKSWLPRSNRRNSTACLVVFGSLPTKHCWVIMLSWARIRGETNQSTSWICFLSRKAFLIDLPVFNSLWGPSLWITRKTWRDLV